ncbi:CocE/NonD family hydrolase [Streptomyces sp. NPDC006617]|uniref:CocE/NonD family hydrolase n=1 Tax=Streptomyces sp. NPDC006617 TaxID=3155354 RepID=UPI0033B94379
MAYTRGFGRSTGCSDFGEPGEQADVKAAINWSAKQSWSHRRSGDERQVVRRVQTSSYLRQSPDGDKCCRARPTRRSGTRSARRSTRGCARWRRPWRGCAGRHGRQHLRRSVHRAAPGPSAPGG